MPEDVKNLEARLADLHRQLSAAESVGPELQGLLTQLLGDIDRLLAKSRGAAPSPQAESFGDRLTEAAQHFQSTHPTLAGTLSGLADALARMGI